MRRLLLAVDGSESARHALAHVIDLAGDMALEVAVVNVQRPMSGDVSLFVADSDLEAHHRTQGEPVVAPVVAELRAHGIECTGHVMVGAYGESIARFADEHDIDGIVMGTRGLGGIAGALLGSVASQVLQGVSVPVTLVK